MPTLQEINAKRKELGVSAMEAKKALTSTAITPTVATPPPATLPAPTQNFPSQPIDQQTVQGVDGQTFKVAPVTPQPTPQAQPAPTQIQQAPEITQPLPPSPTSMPKQVKTEQPIDFNQGLGREQDINNNLNSFYSQGITSPEEIKKSSGYDTADQNKKNIIDSFITAKAPNADALFSSISTRQIVPESVKLTPAYKQAQNRYNRVNMYSSMTPSQVSTAMDGGKIIEGSQTWEDLKVQNPKLAQDVQNLRIVNGSKTNLYTENPDGTKTNNLQKTYEEQFMEDYSDLFKVQTVADIIAQVKTADVVEAETKANQYEDEMNALEADIAKIDADVDAELKGSGATGSRARLEKSVRRAKLTDELTALNKLYTTQANRANQLITQNATALQTQMSQQQARSSAVAGVMMKGYENQLALNQEQALFDQKIAQQAQAMNDPYQAIPAMVDEYKKLGIPFTRSTQQIIQDFEGSGQDLATYLSGLQKTIQGKPEYQKMQALQMGQLSDVQKMNLGYQQDISKMQLQQNFEMKMAQAKNISDNKWTKLDDGLYQDSNGNMITADELKQAKLFNNSYLSTPVGAEGGDCGFYASRGTGMTSTPGGNSKEARFKAFSDTTPQVGGMAFFGGEGYDKTYGHIAIVTGVNPDGSLTVKDSNYGNDGRVQERTVPASSVSGYYNNTPLARGVGGTQGPSDEAKSWVNAWNNGTMDIETILTKIGSTKEAMPLKNEVIKAIDAQGGVAWRKENDPMVSKVQDLIDKLDTSSKSNYINTIAGTVQTSLTNFLSQGKSDLLADLKSVVEGGTLQQLIDAKAQGATFGALSNEELKMLQATSSALAGNAIRNDKNEIVGFRMSESKLKSEIDKLKNLLVEKKDRMTGVGIKSEQSPPTTQQQTNTGAGTIQYGGYQLKPM